MKPPNELAKYLKHATGGVDENALVKMRTLLGWVAKIITLLPQPSRGISVRRSLDGDVWTAGADGFVGAWNPSAVDSTHINLTAGSVSDGITTFTPTVAGIVVDATALNYVYLECDTTPGTLDGYVTGGVITAASVVSYTTPKTNTNTKLYVLLCTWQASALVARYKYWSMTVDTRDTGANATLARYIALP